MGEHREDGRARTARHSVVRRARRSGARHAELHDRDPRDGEGRCLSRNHDLRSHDARHFADRELRNQEQKERFVPLLASGKVLGGFGLTEPTAGSDAAGTKTTAVKKDGHYVINGSKMFITHGGVGEVFVITAVTDPKSGTKGITSFILTKEADLSHRPDGSRHRTRAVASEHEGFRAGKKEDKLGWRASDTRELIFEDVEVPEENRLGEEGMGFINFMQTLDAGRIGIAALSIGIAEGAFEQALQYARGAEAVRTGHRELPGHSVSAFRHGYGDRSGEAPHVSCCVARSEQKAIWKRSRDRKALLLRAGDADHAQGDPDSRRLRLHEGLSCRAHDARREGL